MNIAVIGGGIGGLSASYYLTKKYNQRTHPINLHLIENNDRFGGWIQSERVITHDSERKQYDFLFERGPRSLRSRGGEKATTTLDLIYQLNLHKQTSNPNRSTPFGQLLPANKQANKRYILSETGLQRVGPTDSSLLKQMLLELIKPSSRVTEDESIYSFIEDRFGTYVAETLVSALVCSNGNISPPDNILSITSSQFL